MSVAPAAVIELLVIAVAIPAITLSVAVLLGGRPAWLGREPGRRAEPGIQSFLVLAVLVVVDLALVLVVPFVAAFGGLEHKDTAIEGAFLAFLTLAGIGYAWRRGALRWS